MNRCIRLHGSTDALAPCVTRAVLLSLVLGATASQCLVANEATAGERLSRHIFPLQNKHVHSSSIVQTPDGGFLACWFRGSGERRANDVQIQGARMDADGNAWSDVFLMADTPGLPDCNPVLWIDPHQRLWLFWIVVVANRWEHSVLKYRRATDFQDAGAPKWAWQDTIHFVPGESFARAIADDFAVLRPSEPLWAEYAPRYSKLIAAAARDKIKRQTGWMTRIHPTTLPSGRILLPLYSDGFNLSLVGISDDGGDTWHASRPIVGLGGIQPTLVQKSDGTVVAYMRDAGDSPERVLVSTSSDFGATWSVASDTDVPNPGSSLEVIKLRDGTWIMIFNDTERSRRRIALALSDDEGVSWKQKRTLDELSEGEPGGFGYPSILQSRDGKLHMTYSYSVRGGRSIQHTVVDVAWIHGEAQ